MSSWYVAKARPVTIPYRLTGPVIPHPYKYAMSRLETQDFIVFCPVTKESWVWRGKRWLRERTVFANYLFILLKLEQDGWRSVNNTPGVIHLLPLHAEELAQKSGAKVRATHRCRFPHDKGWTAVDP